MRLIIISLVVATVGCDLYYGSDEGASKHKHAPDAGTCCGVDSGFFPDASVPPDGSGSCHNDGGIIYPDAQLFPDGGFGLPDAALLPDGGYH